MLDKSWPTMSIEDKRQNGDRDAAQELFIGITGNSFPGPLFLGSIATKTCRDARRMQREGRGITSEEKFNEFIGRFTFRRES
jgi:hypothetical protein